MKPSQTQNPLPPAPSAQQPPSGRPDFREVAGAKVTLEDLLHFKRAERPGQEFWEHFEEQLKRRQLAAAIQAKRPWWQALSLTRIAIAIPAGATAALAISFIIWRNDANQAVVPFSPAPFVQASAPAAKPPVTSQHKHTAARMQKTSTTAPAVAATESATAKVAAAQTAPAKDIRNARQVFSPVNTPPARVVASESHAVARSHAFPDFAMVGARRAAARWRAAGAPLLIPASAGGLHVNTSIIRLDANPSVVFGRARLAAATEISNARVNRTANDPQMERLLSSVESNEDSSAAPTVDDSLRIIPVRDQDTSQINGRILSDNETHFGTISASLSIKF